MIDDWKSICILEKIEANQGVGEQVWFVPNPVGGSGGSPNPGTFCNFYTHIRLETVFPAFKLTQNCYVTMNISFSWKLAILL